VRGWELHQTPQPNTDSRSHVFAKAGQKFAQKMPLKLRESVILKFYSQSTFTSANLKTAKDRLTILQHILYRQYKKLFSLLPKIIRNSSKILRSHQITYRNQIQYLSMLFICVLLIHICIVYIGFSLSLLSCRLPEATPTIAINYYYSARMLILILPSHRG